MQNCVKIAHLENKIALTYKKSANNKRLKIKSHTKKISFSG